MPIKGVWADPYPAAFPHRRDLTKIEQWTLLGFEGMTETSKYVLPHAGIMQESINTNALEARGNQKQFA